MDEETEIQITLPLISSTNLGRLLVLPEPPFPYL